MNEEIYCLIEMYKIARQSVEHFDKLLASLRQIIFTVDGVVITAGMTFYLNCISNEMLPEDVSFKYMSLMSGAIIFVIVNLLIWQLEKHYHRYLAASANVAESIEREILGKKGRKISLTFKMRDARNTEVKFDKLGPIIRFFVTRRIYKIGRYVQSYDLLYLLPILGGLGFSWLCLIKCDQHPIFLLGSVTIFAFFWILYIIGMNYFFNKRYSSTKTFERAK